MIAKIIVHGPTRAVALRQARRGAGGVPGGGVGHEPRLSARCWRGMRVFAAGDVDTGLIGRDLEGAGGRPPWPVRE